MDCLKWTAEKRQSLPSTGDWMEFAVMLTDWMTEFLSFPTNDQEIGCLAFRICYLPTSEGQISY